MPDFDLDRALSGEDTWQPRFDWLDANCESRETYRSRAAGYDRDGWNIKQAAYSDYGGSSVDKANIRSLQQMFGEAIRVDHGAYSSEQAWVTEAGVMAMDEETWESLKDTLEGLEDYPVIDDCTLSEVEAEIEDEAWDSWLKADFDKELRKYFSDEIEEHLAAHPKHDDFEERLDEHLWEIFRLSEPEYIHETGCNVHVNLERCLRALDFSGIVALLYPEDPRQLHLPLRTESLVDTLLETDGPHSYSSTQINLPEELAEQLLAWSKANIAEEDLFVDEDGGLGRETEMHVTVKYGLTEEEPSEALLDILSATKPFEIRLGRVSLFTTNEDFDVVKLTVDSPGLRELNRQVAAACPNEDKYPTYQPHCTLAYVKKGRGVQFEGASPWEVKGKMGREPEDAGVFTADTLIFSPSTDTGKLSLPLGHD